MEAGGDLAGRTAVNHKARSVHVMMLLVKASCYSVCLTFYFPPILVI